LARRRSPPTRQRRSPCEDGLASVDVKAFPLARSYDDVMSGIGALYQETHNFKTVVIDSLDWLEPLISARLCRDNRWKSIEDPGYG
jgi:hypothetical protein